MIYDKDAIIQNKKKCGLTIHLMGLEQLVFHRGENEFRSLPIPHTNTIQKVKH